VLRSCLGPDHPHQPRHYAPQGALDGIRTPTPWPRYAKQAVDQQFARWVMLHVQSNPLPICTRPRVLIKLRSGAVDVGTRSGICRLTHPGPQTLKEIGVMAGTTDKAKGLLKETVGKATGDKRMESEGKADRAKGEVKDAAHKVKESSKGVRDSLKKG
jgi:uncharacterized protein YjbJ (UPF0337 family)